MSIVDRIISAMTAELTKHKLELLQHYPNDLLVHDRNMLERAALPGAQIAWMCGHCHTHLVVLGLSEAENENVGYLTNLANDDRFYLLSILADGKTFTLKEVGRDGFRALVTTPVVYSAANWGSPEFTLVRDEQAVGQVHVSITGDYNARVYVVKLFPVEGCTLRDKSALEHWGGRAAVNMAKTLFCKTSIEWLPAYKLAA